ncbi:hypothetical protein DsansV1_C06g0062151 [Dioscorea sansibarensis]
MLSLIYSACTSLELQSSFEDVSAPIHQQSFDEILCDRILLASWIGTFFASSAGL